jgi:hypothetical protein
MVFLIIQIGSSFSSFSLGTMNMLGVEEDVFTPPYVLALLMISLDVHKGHFQAYNIKASILHLGALDQTPHSICKMEENRV